MIRFKQFAQWMQRLHELPIHESVRYFSETNAAGENIRQSSPKGMCEISKTLIGWRPNPSDYWYSQQTIDAASVLFRLRQQAARNGELPPSLGQIEDLVRAVDPVTNEAWNYERQTPKSATLKLVAYDGTIRKVYQLELQD